MSSLDIYMFPTTPIKTEVIRTCIIKKNKLFIILELKG